MTDLYEMSFECFSKQCWATLKCSDLVKILGNTLHYLGVHRGRGRLITVYRILLHMHSTYQGGWEG